MEGSKRPRKPNWTEEQCLLLAQLVEENKAILKGKFGSGVTAQGKRQTWKKISQQINSSFPLVVHTSEECEKRWYVLQSQARREIAAHKWDSSSTGGRPPAKQLSQVAETVFNVLGHSEISVTGLKEGTDSSIIQLMGIQQSMEPSEEPRPSTSQVSNPRPVYQISQPAAATSTPSLLDRKLEIEIDTLTLHKKVLCLQEEYYKLKIELLKYKKNEK